MAVPGQGNSSLQETCSLYKISVMCTLTVVHILIHCCCRVFTNMLFMLPVVFLFFLFFSVCNYSGISLVQIFLSLQFANTLLLEDQNKLTSCISTYFGFQNVPVPNMLWNTRRMCVAN